MEIWIVLKNSWDAIEWKTNQKIYGVYNSEEKANEVKSSLEKEEREYYNSLSKFEKDEWKENGYELDTYHIEKHCVQ